MCHNKIKMPLESKEALIISRPMYLARAINMMKTTNVKSSVIMSRLFESSKK
jgi:hypothetical protein